MNIENQLYIQGVSETLKSEDKTNQMHRLQDVTYLNSYTFRF